MKVQVVWIALTWSMAVVGFPTAAHSQSGQVVCVALQPCDQDGNLLKQFSDPASPCYHVFEMRCALYRTEQGFQTYVTALEEHNQQLAKEVKNLKRSNKRLNTLLRKYLVNR